MNKTLAIIKPDAAVNPIALPLVRSTANSVGLVVVKEVPTTLTFAEAAKLYSEHRGKPFFNDLVSFMGSGPCVVILLEGEDAVSKWRAVIGATDPKAARPGSLRHLLGDRNGPIYRNAVHGSASDSDAQREIALFFGTQGDLAEPTPVGNSSSLN